MKSRKCPHCDHVAVEGQHTTVGDYRIISLDCGHTTTESMLRYHGPRPITYDDGKSNWWHQEVIFDFGAESGWRYLNRSEMAVGKTLNGIAPIKVFPDNFLPAIVICKSKLKYQWFKQIFAATGIVAQVLGGSNDVPYPEIFQVFIVSLDSVDGLLDKLKGLNAKYIIVDEIHKIKNSASNRSQAIQELCSDANLKLYFAGGTPILNNAAEYYVPLHILRPEIFRTYKGFLESHVDTYWDGYRTKLGGLKDPKRFHELTKDFIIGFTRDQALPWLPRVNETTHFVSPDDRRLSAQYDAAERDFLEFYDSIDGHASSFEDYSNLLAKMSRLRHITGLEKVPFAVDYVTSFLIETDRKIAVAVHHIDVGEALVDQLAKAGETSSVLAFTSSLTPEEHEKRKQQFISDPTVRVGVFSTLGNAEGMDGLQTVCADIIMMEPQWSPEYEKQFFDRFPRPGTTAEKINGTHFTALGRIDEYFTELKARKRKIVDDANAGKQSDINWDEQSLMMELADELARRGHKKWAGLVPVIAKP